MYRLLIAAAFLFSILTTPSAEGIEQDSNGIPLLDEKNFDEAIKNNTEIFVLFYEPTVQRASRWGPLKRFCMGGMEDAKALVQAAAAGFKKQHREIKMGEINIIDNPSVRERYENEAFPALLYFKNGKFTFGYAIKASTTTDRIMNWILCRILLVEVCRYRFAPLE